MAAEETSRSAGSKPPPVRTRRPGTPPVYSGKQGSSRSGYPSAQKPQSGSHPGVRSKQIPQSVPHLGVWTTQTPQSGSRPGVRSQKTPQSVPRLGVWTTQPPQSGSRSGVHSTRTPQSGVRLGVHTTLPPKQSAAIRTTTGSASSTSVRFSTNPTGTAGPDSRLPAESTAQQVPPSSTDAAAHSTRNAVPRTWRYFRWFLRPAERERAAFRRYTLLCSLAAVALYGVVFALLSLPLNRLTAQWSSTASALTRALIPALLGTAVCTAPWPLMDWDPRVLAASYRLLSILSTLVLVGLQALVWGDWETQRLTVHFFASFFLCPLLLGTPVSLLLCFLWWIHPEDSEGNMEEEYSGET